MIKCIIIEDEPLAAEKLAEFISKISFLKLEKSFYTAIDAITFLKEEYIDLIFLDIEMKELTGIELLESLNIQAEVIITTAYDKYALKAYDLNVCDYLLKPISFERFVKAGNKAYEQIKLKQVNSGSRKIFLKTEYRLEGIDIHDILFIEGCGDYLKIICKNRTIVSKMTFQEVLKHLPLNGFYRVHNSFIVALEKIERIERNRILIGDNIIPISKSRSKIFYNLINKT